MRFHQNFRRYVHDGFREIESLIMDGEEHLLHDISSAFTVKQNDPYLMFCAEMRHDVD